MPSCFTFSPDDEDACACPPGPCILLDPPSSPDMTQNIWLASYKRLDGTFTGRSFEATDFLDAVEFADGLREDGWRLIRVERR